MGVIETKVFRTAHGLAVQLPDDAGFDAGMAVTVKFDERSLVVSSLETSDPVEEKRKLTKLMADLAELGPVFPVERREPIAFPERPGL